jgi:hypothetical protein
VEVYIPNYLFQEGQRQSYAPYLKPGVPNIGALPFHHAMRKRRFTRHPLHLGHKGEKHAEKY